MGRIDAFIGGTPAAPVKQWEERFSYDVLGRLDVAAEYRGDTGALAWRVDYDYDRYGNRFQGKGQNSGLPYAAVQSTDISAATNRYTSRVTYDGAGQITSDSRFRQMQYQYDANGRVKWSAKLDGTYAATSVSDGLGQRVQTTQGGVSRRFIYDRYGRVAAEYEGATLKRLNVYAGASSQLIAVDEMLAGGEREAKYVVADRQGSTRALLDANGVVISRHDYLPFGEEIGAGTGMRTTAQGYGASDNLRQRYAGTQRDEATGLEHTLWRKLDAVSGRWTSPDPYGESMRVTKPQSFNRYSYVQNDPVNSVDPTGLDEITINTGPPVTVIGTINSAVRGGTLSSLAGLIGGRDGSLLDAILEVGIGGETGGDPPETGGQFTPDQQKQVDNLNERVKKLLQNPECAEVLGGTRNAQALLDRAQVRSANTANPAYRGTDGRFPDVARQARDRAENPDSNNVAFSEVSIPGLAGRNVYLNDRFFGLSPTNQETVFIHELNRLNGLRGDDFITVLRDYAQIAQGCGTTIPISLQ